MNPLVQKQFQQLNVQLGQLHDAVRTQQEQASRQAVARKDLLQNFWRAEKQAAALGAEQAQYGELHRRNTALEDLIESLELHLAELHQQLKLLREALSE